MGVLAILRFVGTGGGGLRARGPRAAGFVAEVLGPSNGSRRLDTVFACDPEGLRPGGGELAPAARCRDSWSSRLSAEDCCSWICRSRPCSYSRLPLVKDLSGTVEPRSLRLGMVGVGAVRTEPAPWEATDVAAVEVRPFDGTEAVEDEVSRFLS